MIHNFTTEQALQLWQSVLAAGVSDGTPDLTMRQMALLLTVYVTQPPHTVRGMAALLNISKPAVTRALDRLCELGFAQRRRDETDRRSVLVQRTVKGSVYLSELAELIDASAAQVQEIERTAA